MSKMTLNYTTRHGREKSLLLAPIIQDAIAWKKTLNYYSLYGRECICKACKKFAA